MEKHSTLRRRNLHLGSHGILLVWSVVVLFPLWVLIMGSLKSKTEIYQNPLERGLYQVVGAALFLRDGLIVKHTVKEEEI